MGRIVERNMPCLKCSSSDATQIYEEGPAKCFSCGASYFYYGDENKSGGDVKIPATEKDKARILEVSRDYPSRGIQSRRISKQVAEFFGVKASYDKEGNIERYFFPFFEDLNSEHPSGYKIKNPKDKKDTITIGSPSFVFGLNKFRSGGEMLVITEGEEDAMAVAQASLDKYNKIYPVISMGGAQQTSYLLKNREEILKFKKIVLWFDNDEQGQGAVPKAARILGFDKIKVAVSQEKDACDVLLTRGQKGIWDCVFGATNFSPAEIVQGENTWELYNNYKKIEFVPWPPFLSKLNSMTFGRALGSITMIAAGTGVGKTTFVREDIFNLINTTPPEEKIGCCFLEEDIGETTSGLMSIYLNKRLGLPTTQVTEEEERAAWEAVMGTNKVMLLDHQGSVSDGSLIDKIEFMILSGCKYIYLDHITIAVSSSGSDTNAAIDSMMEGLLKLVKRHGAWIGVISHLRKVQSGEESFETGGKISEDDLKGSGSMKQISFQTIGLSRNKLSENESTRHVSRVWLLKDRRTGQTGPAGSYKFNASTGRLEDTSDVEENLSDDDFEIIT